MADSWFEDSPIREAIELAEGIRIEPVPQWVKDDEALKLLSWLDRESIQNAELAFTSEYEADALGSPDLAWKGSVPRGIQASIGEKFALANVALWLVKPTRLTARSVMHFSRKGDPTSLRQFAAVNPVLISDSESDNAPTVEDIERAGEILKLIVALPRNATLWTAIRTLTRAVAEGGWEVRYLLQWIVLEALFGPDNPNETTYRLAQRIGLFLGSSAEDRRRIFDEARQAYGWRSRIVHGSRLSKLTSEKSLELSATIEAIVRAAITKILSSPSLVLQFDGDERDNRLDDLIFR